MKTTALVGLGLLTLSLVANAAAPDSRHVPLVERSISGVLEGTVAFSFDANYALVTLGNSAGVLRHLGPATLETSHQTSDGGTIIKNGVFTIVADNGDKIRGTFQGTATWYMNEDWTEGVAIGQTVFTVTGGTGRFAQATGAIKSTSCVTFLGWDVWEWPVTWVWEGTLSY